jgi:hypothetical protein
MVPKFGTLSVETPLCPYGIVYRRAYGLSCRWTVPFSDYRLDGLFLNPRTCRKGVCLDKTMDMTPLEGLIRRNI